MFFWGMDAASPSGNLFEKSGFSKSPSPGLKGTSCYSLKWQKGEIFLHGACVGWLQENSNTGFIYIRPIKGSFILSDSSPPVPGIWEKDKLSVIELLEDLPVITPFLNWWLAHEAFVATEMGTTYRSNCHRKYKSLPKSNTWLSPKHAVEWIAQLIDNPLTTPRAKQFSRLKAL